MPLLTLGVWAASSFSWFRFLFCKDLLFSVFLYKILRLWDIISLNMSRKKERRSKKVIVISSESENEQKLKPSSTLEKQYLLTNPTQSNHETQNNNNCDVIDSIVQTLKAKLSKKHKKKKKKRRRSRRLSNSGVEFSETLINEYNPSRGLRKRRKSVELFQADTSCISKHKKRKSTSFNEVQDVDNGIQYLLHNTPVVGVNQLENGTEEEEEASIEFNPNIDAATQLPIEEITILDDVEVCGEADKQDQVEADPPLYDEGLNNKSKHDVGLYFEQKQKVFRKVIEGVLDINDICLTCGSSENITDDHPLFQGGLCETHKTMFQDWFFLCDKDGCQSYCTICCMGEKVVLCDNEDCGRCFCTDCLDLMVGAGQYDKLVPLDKWSCYVCTNDSSCSLIVKREDWQEKLRLLHPEAKYQKLVDVPKPMSVGERKPIRVLSLFDGIATGVVALKQLGLQIQKFVASEIDEAAIRLVQNRHPEVMHVGDITKLTDDDITRYGPFDLVMGGSPCNDLSGANPRRKGLLDQEGTGCLFFDFFRVLRAAEPPRCDCDNKEHQRPFFWLFENVLSMKMVERERISRFLQCQPVVANGRAVSAAARPRLFWGNLPGLQSLTLTPSPGDRLTVQSCLEHGRLATIEKLNTITTRSHCLYQGHTKQAPVMHMGKEDVLWSTEVERIFGLPEHYTDVNNHGPKERLALLGRSWSVPVVKRILAPLRDYFACGEVLEKI
uniref:DNA (cytosine-5)-methyltransferase 3A-like isoform X1 n=1 Tax=Ciona intestinalis TaxID=7719 RepID=UPI000EF46F84|nr:DNA (cytosine-5)-methyltransferase 3A-like isoform X1 [Ciona intestinalis]|eukprot:XP_026693797.1 DNA (cytosine-5)-methyltransferase 3A-like isoform X1 [Ciona intestinalis]